MRWTGRLGAAWLATALFGLACSPSDDEGTGRDVPHPGDARDDGGGGADTDADPDGDVVEPDVVRDIPDYSFDNVCGAEDLPLEYTVSSDVLIVLDRSGSMVMTLASLKTAVNTIVDAADDRIWFGLMPFPSTVAPNECGMIANECAAPDHPQVTPAPLRAPDIAAALVDIRFCGSTPTSVTLANARAYLASAPTGHTQYVLLATDGVPNCNSSLDWTTCTCLDTETGCTDRPEACLDDAASYAALDALLVAGVRTYVLGMGRWLGTDRDVMDNMAVHGGTEHFYAAEDPSRILATFEEIMGTIVVSCTFDLHPGSTVDPTQVNLYVSSVLVPQDPSHGDGWDYVDGDTVEFYGPICDTILSGDVGNVSAAYGCPTVIL